MKDAVWNFISSPEFLVGGVFFSFVLNVVAAYVKEAIDRRISRFSSGRRNKMAVLAAKTEERVARLVANPEELQQIRHMEIVYTVREASMLAVSLGAIGAFAVLIVLRRSNPGNPETDEILSFVIPGLGVIASLSMIVLFSLARWTGRLKAQVDEAVRRRAKAAGFEEPDL